MGEDNIQRIKLLFDQLQKESMRVGQSVYQKAQAQAPADGGPQEGENHDSDTGTEYIPPGRQQVTESIETQKMEVLICWQSEEEAIFSDPLEEIQREMDRLFNDAFKGLSNQSRETTMFSPEVDIYEKDNSVFIEMDIRESRRMNWKSRWRMMFSLSKERRNLREQKERDYHRYERYSGAFQRIFRLPDYVKRMKSKPNTKMVS